MSWFELNPIASLLLIVFTSSLFTLGFVEAALRLTIYKGLITLPTFPQYYHLPDDKIGYDIAESFTKGTHVFFDHEYPIFSNRLGCFDEELKENKVDLLLLGDSFTWGFTPFERKWGTILEDQLGKRVLKCGVSGFGTKQALIKGKKTISKIKMSPELIVLGYFPNDLNDDYFLPDTVIDGYRVSRLKRANINSGKVQYYSAEEMRQRLQSYLSYKNPNYLAMGIKDRLLYWMRWNFVLPNLMRSYIPLFSTSQNSLQYMTGRYDIPLGSLNKQKFPWIQKVWEVHKTTLRKFKKLANDAHSILLIVMIPTYEQVYNINGPKNSDAFNQARKNLKEFFKKENIDYLDLLYSFQEHAKNSRKRWIQQADDLYWQFDKHWNVRGNELAGMVVSQYIVEQGLLNITEDTIKK